ncbi:tetratricopeptide repeat protein [Microbulbifer hainanensis]|uniref:tetratricopeptide repeat protein n=1 Tax=Microbulbifer hainanensis TaxID=2735675 RepID=UPI0018683051|nr:tetratricopeptide repeat protein [Microbulbifer hainanensis]
MNRLIFVLCGALGIQQASALDCKSEIDKIIRSGEPFASQLAEIEQLENHCSNGEYYTLVKGQLLAKNRQYAESVKLLNSFGEPKVYREEFAILNAKAHIMLSKNDDAKNILSRYISSNGRSRKALLLVGQIASSEEDYDLAIDYFERALSLGEEPKSLRGLGLAWFAKGDCDKALDSFNSALQLDEKMYGDLGLMIAASRCYSESGEFKVSRNILGLLLQANPKVEKRKEFLEAIQKLREDVKHAQTENDGSTDADQLKVKN